MKLPTEPTPAVAELDRASILLYGPVKVGKTTIAASFPRPLFAATEDGQKFIEAYRQPVTTWQDFLDLSEAFQKEKHEFRTLVIDTADMLFQLCQLHVCEKLGVEHPSEKEYGKGWDALYREFTLALSPLAKMPSGLVFLSHEKSVEVQGRAVKLMKTVPTMPGQARRIIMPLVDVVGHCTVEDGERIVRFVPTEDAEAGARGEIARRLPAQVPMLERGWYASLQAFFSGAALRDEKTNGHDRPRRRFRKD